MHGSLGSCDSESIIDTKSTDQPVFQKWRSWEIRGTGAPRALKQRTCNTIKCRLDAVGTSGVCVGSVGTAAGLLQSLASLTLLPAVPETVLEECGPCAFKTNRRTTSKGAPTRSNCSMSARTSDFRTSYSSRGQVAPRPEAMSENIVSGPISLISHRGSGSGFLAARHVVWRGRGLTGPLF